MTAELLLQLKRLSGLKDGGELSGSVHMWVVPGGFIGSRLLSPSLISLLRQSGKTFRYHFLGEHHGIKISSCRVSFRL